MEKETRLKIAQGNSGNSSDQAYQKFSKSIQNMTVEPIKSCSVFRYPDNGMHFDRNDDMDTCSYNPHPQSGPLVSQLRDLEVVRQLIVGLLRVENLQVFGIKRFFQNLLLI